MTGSQRRATITTKRYYQLGTTTVAVRDSAGAGSLNYLLGDQLGSTTVSVNAAGGTPVVQRYLPYGAPRSTTGGSVVTDKGWIGQTRDNSTGLQYLNARYYDPVIGRFTAVDPVVADADSLDRYGYAAGSPVTLSDPTGLCIPEVCGHRYPAASPRHPGGDQRVTGNSSGVLGLISGEMAANRSNEDVKALRALHYPCLFCNEGFGGPGWLLNELTHKKSLGGLFRTGGAWDHKRRVFGMIGSPDGGGYVLIKEGFAVRGDVFSNLHYGYIMNYSGDSLGEAQRLQQGRWNLLEKAGAAVTGSDLPATGENSPADDVAVAIGFDLCHCPKGEGGAAPPSSAQIREALIANEDQLRDSGGACTPGRGCLDFGQWSQAG
jgi:RHS repeat-associated protein